MQCGHEVLARGAGSRYERQNKAVLDDFTQAKWGKSVSDTDSFINEVSEEVRKDALYVYVRKYGWIAVLAVLAIVGGATWNEISKARTTSAAQATGDALIEALNANDPAARADALAAVETAGPASAVTALLTAGSQMDNDDRSAAAATLQSVATDPDAPQLYRDLAAFKVAMIDTGDAAARRTSLEALAQPGAVFGLLAQEQLALMDVAEGETDAAIARLRAIAEDAGVTRGLLERTQTLMVALGVDVSTLSPANQEQASE